MVDNSWLCAYICYNFKINMHNMDVKLYLLLQNLQYVSDISIIFFKM